MGMSIGGGFTLFLLACLWWLRNEPGDRDIAGGLFKAGAWGAILGFPLSIINPLNISLVENLLVGSGSLMLIYSVYRLVCDASSQLPKVVSAIAGGNHAWNMKRLITYPFVLGLAFIYFSFFVKYMAIYDGLDRCWHTGGRWSFELQQCEQPLMSRAYGNPTGHDDVAP